MLGAMCGDILGSSYEFGFEDNEDNEIYLMHVDDHMTDDSALTCAVAEWMMEYGKLPLGKGEQQYLLAKGLYKWTIRYIDKAYGIKYIEWLEELEKTGKVPPPADSFGNGAAMRVSPIAYGYSSIEEVEKYAYLQTTVTHGHKEAARGACAIAVATKMALDGKDKNTILSSIMKRYGYDLLRPVSEVKMGESEFSASSQVTVPQAFIAFREGNDYEDVIIQAIKMGGDCDTVAAMAGSIAYAYYKEIPEYLLKHCMERMDQPVVALCKRFEEKYIR